MSEDKKICMRLDLLKMSQADDLSLNDEVTITVTGVVKQLRGPEEGMRESYLETVGKAVKKGKEEKYVYPGEVKVEVSDVKIKRLGEFDMEDD